MEKKTNNISKSKDQPDFPGYPAYPSSEDIYNNAKEETDLDPEDPKHKKAPNEPYDRPNEINNMKDMSGQDLDIPGAELDDLQEELGSEDEENNFYSLGGDAHENQEEDKTQS